MYIAHCYPYTYTQLNKYLTVSVDLLICKNCQLLALEFDYIQGPYQIHTNKLNRLRKQNNIIVLTDILMMLRRQKL